MHSNNDDIREVDFWFRRGLIYTVISVVVISILGFILHANGLIFNTILEREAYENSYQYTEARKSEISEYEATLAQIDMQLADPEVDKVTKKNLKSQRAAVMVRLNAARDKADQAVLQD